MIFSLLFIIVVSLYNPLLQAMKEPTPTEPMNINGEQKKIFTLKDHFEGQIFNPVDRQITRSLFEKEALQGNMEALMPFIGYAFENNTIQLEDIVDENISKQFNYFTDYEPKNNLEACYFGVFFLQESFKEWQKSIENPEERGLRYLFKADQEECALASYYLYTFYDRKKNAEAALKYLKKSALKDYPPALNMLGLFYKTGIILKKDYEQAYLLFKKAANYDYGYAFGNLGRMYFDGEFVNQNYEFAAKYCEHGQQFNRDSKILYYLALSYKHLNKKENEWLPLLDEAAKNGMSEAQTYLIQYYIDKKDIERNMDTIQLFAKIGSKNAQYVLGKFYIKGKYGLQSDPRKGVELIEQAAQNGHKLAKQYLDGSTVQFKAHTSIQPTNTNILSWFSFGTKK